jgi:hypothetical protein
MDNNESTHKVFVDSMDDVMQFNPVEYFETNENLLGNKTNRIKKNQLDKIKVKIYLTIVNCRGREN